MSALTAAHDELAQARAAGAAAQLAAWQAVQTQRSLSAALRKLAATTDPADRAGAAKLEELQQQVRAADAEAAAATQRAAQAGEAAAAALGRFAQFADPRESIGLFPDSAPITLLPVRVETRFVGPGTADNASPQLWVRIYPDDCSIDTFEPTLSDAEVTNAKLYWQRIWAAGGVEADERAAWRDLVSAHGSGRAGFIVDTYQPVNLADSPQKARDSDEILVIATQTPLAAAESTVISAYWLAIWLADDDATARQAAAAALAAAVGAARAAALIADYVPVNLGDTPAAPLTKHQVASSVAFVVLPPDPPPKQSSWSQAPQVRQFPERFVVLGYQGGELLVAEVGGLVTLPLYTGPDPSADPSTGIHPVDDGLFVPEQLQWLVDFERAVAAGMALAIDLTPELARSGFDRLLVLGIQMSASADDGAAALTELLRHHQCGRAGLALVQQGTPTHNTTGNATGYTRLDDSDQSFDDRRNAPLFTPVTDPMAKRDGQWLAETLGIDPSALMTVHGAGGSDQLQARAMQRALWPATMGYWMDKMLTPVFGDETISQARWFFTNYVRGRGSVPALRVGHQPYGILLTTAFSRIAWPTAKQDPRKPSVLPPSAQQFLVRLLALLREVDGDWTTMSSGAAYVGKPGDAHQTLLDVIGLLPASVEYYWRYSESLTELYNVINLWGLGPQFWQALLALGLQAAGEQLLARLGAGAARPDILQHAFLTDAGLITELIDDRPLSQTAPIRAYTPDGRNYLQWLIDSASTSLDALTSETGFTNDSSPQALLYLMLRHALQLGYYDASYELYKSAGFLTAAELAAMKPEPPFIHVDQAATESESRYSALYTTEPRITGNPTMLVSDYITQNLALPEAAGLADQVAALSMLVDAPTAALERLFAEHVDTCSYRFDAWLLGLVDVQLQAMRAAAVQRGEDGSGGGSYLGAYAWVEDLRPSGTVLAPAQLPADLESAFAGSTPLMRDPGNEGYIHAPSLPHSRTAAILRGGYLANATSANPDTLSVNLSSDRVRAALSVLEGIRNGQSIGALLGYQFERGLHDDHGLAEVDKFIYPMRKAFPLVADSLSDTQTLPGVPIEAIEARNVLDGRKLADQIRTSGVTTYPFGVASLPAASAAEAAAIDGTANALLDTYDAIADLALAEGVHQAAQGNFDRVAATVNAYSNAGFPPDPEVVQTPATGIGLTHRVAVHLRPGLTAPAGATPRATVEPALDAWLESLLPPLSNIGVVVAWTNPVGGASQSLAVTLANLRMRPRDLIELVKPDDVQAMTELDDRITRYWLAHAALRPDARPHIRYQQAPAGKLSVFEVSALIRQLRQLLQRARPLRATDAALANQARPDQNSAVFADRARVAGPKAQLDTLSADVAACLASLRPLLADPVANRAALVGGIDHFIDQAVGLLERAAWFGLPQAGWGFAYDWRCGALVDLMAQVTKLVTRWNARLTSYDTQIAAYDALPAGTQANARFAALQTAEALITTALEPLPALPAALRVDLDGMRAAFVAKRDAFAAIPGTGYATFGDALTAVEGLLPVSAFDPVPWDVTAFGDRAVAFAQDLFAVLTGQATAIDARRTATQAQLDVHDAATSAAAQVQALQDAARALLGDSFALIPEFAISDSQGTQWASSLAAAAPGGALLQYLTMTAGIDRPVQEWFCGAARVRPVLRDLELAGVLADGFGRPAPELTPAQFPYLAGEPWLAMQFPDGSRPDGDRLLYTAHYVTPFDKTARQCGLLLDEWTEVIPGTSKETGITFNFARPDNEPPQAILVVAPATGDGAWHWDDVVGSLNETLDLAKKRALEPAQIDATAYSEFLPATIMAVTLYGISITTAMAVANGVLASKEVVSRA
jgi:hypothetical protein